MGDQSCLWLFSKATPGLGGKEGREQAVKEWEGERKGNEKEGSKWEKEKTDGEERVTYIWAEIS